MTEEEYAERRRALEQELQRDLALIHAAHEARVRSLDSSAGYFKDQRNEDKPAEDFIYTQKIWPMSRNEYLLLAH